MKAYDIICILFYFIYTYIERTWPIFSPIGQCISQSKISKNCLFMLLPHQYLRVWYSLLWQISFSQLEELCMKHMLFWLAIYCEKVVWQTHLDFLPIVIKHIRKSFWKMAWKELLTLMCETEFSLGWLAFIIENKWKAIVSIGKTGENNQYVNPVCTRKKILIVLQLW